MNGFQIVIKELILSSVVMNFRRRLALKLEKIHLYPKLSERDDYHIAREKDHLHCMSDRMQYHGAG